MIPSNRTDVAATIDDEALCAALRGEEVSISGACIAAARSHQLHLLLAQGCLALVETDSDRLALAAELRAAAIADLFRERELQKLLRALDAAGLEALLLKGAGLAYTLYASAHVRPRGDVDLLIARGELEAADRLLRDSGWRPAKEQDSPHVTTQRHYVLGAIPSSAEHLDLHWKIAVPAAFGDALGFAELMTRAVPIDVLGAGARTLSAPDALFLACLHRVAHHHDTRNLLWLWDIHLLVSSLSDTERAFFITLADTRAMRAVCARGVELAFRHFATASAATLLDALRPASGSSDEPSAAFLTGGMRPIASLGHELRAIRRWRTRIAMVGAHLFPNRVYVRSLYPGWPAASLPLAYVDRIVRGAPKWFRRPSE